MKTVAAPSTLSERIRAAWRAAIDRRFVVSEDILDFVAGIAVEATDGEEPLPPGIVAQWLDGSATPNYRYIRAIAKVAQYDRAATRQLLYGGWAPDYLLNEKDWRRFLSVRSESPPSS